jgi:hypothetical protein
MKQIQVYKIDLRKIEGEGDLQCPKCGVVISPDDTSEEVYSVIDVKENKDGLMEEMTIQCLKCRSEIRLTGFLELKENW